MVSQGYGTPSASAPGAPTPPAAPPAAPPVPPAPPTGPRYPRRGGIGLGVVLIAIGLIFLLGQFLPGVAWWQMWPLIIVFLGGLQIVTPDAQEGWGVSRVMDGIGTVILGLVLLGNTTGYISWGVWWVLLTLWPVLLIALGVSIIGKALHQTWIRVLAPVMVWLAFAYAVSVSFTGAGGFQPYQPAQLSTTGQSFSLSAPVDGATTGNLLFDGGAGDIRLSAIDDALVSAKGTSPFGTPQFSVTRAGTAATVHVGPGPQRTIVVTPGFTGGSVDVGMNRDVLWDATLQTGATSTFADFTRLKMRSLTVKTGASSVTLHLGDVPDAVATANVVVKAGVSSVDLTVPRSAAVRVTTQNGLSSTNVLGTFTRQSDGSWETPGYASASHKYVIDIESGVGSVSVKQS